jgi:hypothetical protein
MDIVSDLATAGGDNRLLEYRQRNREQDIVYRNLQNKRRDIDNARRVADEKTEQLKAIGELATMIAFFAVSALCEITIPENTNWIVILIFGVLAALVVSF